MTGVVDLVFLNVSLVPALLHASDDDESTAKIAVAIDQIDGGTKAEPALEAVATDASVAPLVAVDAAEKKNVATANKPLPIDGGLPVPVDASPLPAIGIVKNTEPVSVSKKSAEIEGFRPHEFRWLNRSLLFANDRDRLTSKASEHLSIVARRVRKSGLIVRLSGHSDEVGNLEYNDELSNRRVQAVVRYLLRHGVAQDQIDTSYFGERHLLPHERRRKQRRVELIVERLQ